MHPFTQFARCCFAAVLLTMIGAHTSLTARPFDGTAFKGRIAYSADGNHNDPDDWIASPVALAIFSEAGVKDRLVHFDYNCILPQTDLEWEKIHADSVLGAVERYGYDRSLFHDCRKNVDQAIASIAKAINESSEDNPLYFIIAGPMEVPYLGIQKSQPEQRKFVYCISHSRWNDGFASKYTFTHTKRSVIEQDVHWVQIRDQNRLLNQGRFGTPSKPEEFAAYFWMRDSQDPKVQFLWERMLVSTRPDPSDSGMAYFLITGDEECDPAKLKRLLEDKVAPAPINPRAEVRIEAENFRRLDGCQVDDRNDRNASHRLNVKLVRDRSGSIRTRFDQPYAASHARFDVDVRYFDDPEHRSRFVLLVNGVPISRAWESLGKSQAWTTHAVPNVEIRTGDEIGVQVNGPPARLDYVQLNFRQSVARALDRTDRRPGVSVRRPEVRDQRSEVRDRRPEVRGRNVELDDPNAMIGGLIVAGSNPGYLKYNGGKPVFLAGPDNPEEFITKTSSGASRKAATNSRAAAPPISRKSAS